MVERQLDWWVSFGVHIDLKRRLTALERLPYGPYIALHFLFWIVCVGYHPHRALELGL